MRLFALLLAASTVAMAASPGYVYNAVVCYTGAPVGATAVGICVNNTNAALDSVSKVAAYAKKRGDTLFVAVDSLGGVISDSSAALRAWAEGEFVTPAGVGSIISSQVPGMLSGYETVSGAQAKADTAEARGAREGARMADSATDAKLAGYATPSYVTGAVAGALTPYATRAQVGDSADVLRLLMRAIAHDTANARLSAYLTAAQTVARIGDSSAALRILIAALPNLSTVQSQADSIARHKGAQDSLYARQRDTAMEAASWPKQAGWTAATGTANKGAFNADGAPSIGGVVLLGITLPVQSDIQAFRDWVTAVARRVKALEDAARNKERPGP